MFICHTSTLYLCQLLLATTRVHFSHLQEAALVIWEGESNAKFYRHPTTKWSKRAYAILNNPFYHLLHFSVCNVLLLLALAELPSVEEDFITIDLYLKFLLPVSN